MSRLFVRTSGKRVQADPKAKPTPAVVLDESNSTFDPLQPDCRKAKVLNGRAFVRAGVLEEQDAAAAAAAKKATPPAP